MSSKPIAFAVLAHIGCSSKPASAPSGAISLTDEATCNDAKETPCGPKCKQEKIPLLPERYFMIDRVGGQAGAEKSVKASIDTFLNDSAAACQKKYGDRYCAADFWRDYEHRADKKLLCWDNSCGAEAYAICYVKPPMPAPPTMLPPSR